jgi:hypothetical protein
VVIRERFRMIFSSSAEPRLAEHVQSGKLKRYQEMTPMKKSKLLWTDGSRQATARFSIPYVGELTVEVESELPGADTEQSTAERRALAIRHAKLLLRNLANELDRQSG